jgi:VanZ family protein
MGASIFGWRYDPDYEEKVQGYALSLVRGALLAALLGAADELHQLYLPGRVASVADWLADLVGVLVAAGLLWWWRSVPEAGR